MGSDMEVTRLSGSLGAEVRGFALRDIGPAEAKEIESLLIEHQVLFFPGQAPSVEEHVAFGRHFGRLEGHPNLANPFEDEGVIFELAATRGGIADEWHSDLSCQAEPSMIAILHMVTCPPVGGERCSAGAGDGSIYAAAAEPA